MAHSAWEFLWSIPDWWGCEAIVSKWCDNGIFDSCKETEFVTDASPLGLSAILFQKTPGTSVSLKWNASTRKRSRRHWLLFGLLTIPVLRSFHYTDWMPSPNLQPEFSGGTCGTQEEIKILLTSFPGIYTCCWKAQQDVIAEDYVYFLSTHAVSKATTLAEIQKATTADPTLQKLVELICGD